MEMVMKMVLKHVMKAKEDSMGLVNFPHSFSTAELNDGKFIR